MELKCWETVQPPSHVTVHTSHVTCLILCTFFSLFSYTVVELVGWEFVIHVAYPVNIFFFNLGFWWFFYDTLPNLGGLIWCSAILFWYLILKYPIHFSISYSLPQFHDKLVVLLFAHILGGCVKGLWWLMEEVKGKIWKYRGLGY